MAIAKNIGSLLLLKQQRDKTLKEFYKEVSRGGHGSISFHSSLGIRGIEERVTNLQRIVRCRQVNCHNE